MHAVRTPKKPPEAPGTRQRLMEAARAEFGDKGIEAATTRGIAERAGCNEVTLFRHFESKQKLLGAVVQDTSEEFLALCECGGGFSGDLVEDLARFARVYNASMERCEGMARAMIGEGRRRPTLAKELIGDVLDPFHRSIAGYLEQHQQAGRVRADLDTMAFAEVLTSALMGGLLRRSSGLSALDRDGWIRETVEIFVRGIGV
ncbi:MAG: TetR/AcrR family transcriptional regulator [Verrucomicrobiota bacterium]